MNNLEEMNKLSEGYNLPRLTRYKQKIRTDEPQVLKLKQ